MFIACPQCRYLVATDPRTQAAPAQCPRCGVVLIAGADTPSATAEFPQAAGAAGSGQSLASMLRRDDSAGAADKEQVTASVVEAESSHPLPTAAVEEAPSVSALSVDGQELSTPDNQASDAAQADDHADTAPVIPLAAASAPLPSPSPSAATQSPSTSSSAALPRGPRAPAFLRGRGTTVARHGTPLWQWAAVVVLLLSLVLQMLLADRARLAADAAWRPLLSSICQVLGCSIPAWREPQAFVMLDRDVRPLPSAAGVLHARATFRNDARWSQPWPILLLTLKDADGRDLGARAITPAEYLREGATMTELAPGQSAQVAVNLREPSANVVAFSFDFR